MALHFTQLYFNPLVYFTKGLQATYCYRLFDIGMMIFGTCCDADRVSLDKAKSFLTGYQKYITLVEAQTKALQNIAINVLTILGYEFNKKLTI